MSRALRFVVPDSIDDPARPSGGNIYDRRVCAELEGLGWSVRMRPVAGAWPAPEPADVTGLVKVLDEAPPNGCVLIDGLVASAVPELVTRYADSVQVAVLVHLPLGVLSPGQRAPEAAMLRRVAVLTTSTWTRSWLLSEYGLASDTVHVAVPGTDLGPLAPGTRGGGALLCVGAVTPVKGQDQLVEALASLDLPGWRCTCVGSVEPDPVFAAGVTAGAAEAGIADRLVLAGALDRAGLEAAYGSADVLVLASRAETYGMVVTEALARGLPVVAMRTGGIAEALGSTADGTLPGVLVPPGDTTALCGALHTWLDDPGLRERLRAAAQERRRTLPTWRDTAARIGGALSSA
ncbi:glycosyltransferase involved in cell wall biosynthesis [Marmoricola sp. URHA0025 HA25]